MIIICPIASQNIFDKSIENFPSVSVTSILLFGIVNLKSRNPSNKQNRQKSTNHPTLSRPWIHKGRRADSHRATSNQRLRAGALRKKTGWGRDIKVIPLFFCEIQEKISRQEGGGCRTVIPPPFINQYSWGSRDTYFWQRTNNCSRVFKADRSKFWWW